MRIEQAFVHKNVHAIKEKKEPLFHLPNTG